MPSCQGRHQRRRSVVAVKIQMSEIPKPRKKFGALAFVIGSVLLALVALGASVALAVFLIRLIFWF
jgi:hypothetical protein